MKDATESTDIPYRVRISKRARRMQLQVMVHGEVEVVLPQGMSPAQVPLFVARHRDWILRARARQMANLPRTSPEARLPSSITFPAIAASWTVNYRFGDGGEIQERPGVEPADLVVKATSESDALRRLQRWLGIQGRLHLVPWLRAVAVELGLSYRRVSIRGQRSRWGSYSSRGTLSLNRALLFLEPALVRHLFIHELCHSVHLNHSPRFWRLVARYSPRYQELEQALNRAVATIPRWALERISDDDE